MKLSKMTGHSEKPEDVEKAIQRVARIATNEYRLDGSKKTQPPLDARREKNRKKNRTARIARRANR